MSFKNKQTKSIGLAAQKVVDALCARLEAGVNPWVKPWSVSGEASDDPEAFAVNLFTGKPYTGINQAMLAPGYYTTAKQAFAHGGSVAKGKGQTAVFYKDGEIRVKDEEAKAIKEILPDFMDAAKRVKSKKYGEGYAFTPNLKDRYVVYDNGTVTKAIPMARAYLVWALRDTTGLESFVPERPKGGDEKRFNPLKEGERMIEAYRTKSGLHVFANDGGNRAFYRPIEDGVHLPKKEFFRSPNEYYSTALHELTHSTGHFTRLNRRGITSATASFGSQTYSEEELVAEIGAAMSMGYLGISTENTEANSAAYLAGWASHLRSNKTLAEKVIQAASAGKKAFALMAGYYEQQKAEDGEDGDEALDTTTPKAPSSSEAETYTVQPGEESGFTITSGEGCVIASWEARPVRVNLKTGKIERPEAVASPSLVADSRPTAKQVRDEVRSQIETLAIKAGASKPSAARMAACVATATAMYFFPESAKELEGDILEIIKAAKVSRSTWLKDCRKAKADWSGLGIEIAKAMLNKATNAKA